MFDIPTLIIIIATFLLAGTIKGTVGLGLPTVSLALLTVAIDMPTAMALMLVPAFVSNIWQATAGGQGRIVLARIWPFLLMATTMVWLGALALTRIDLHLLSALLGVLLMAYAGVNLAGFRLQLQPQQARWAGPLIGIVNGVITGMTGSFVMPGVIYLQAIGLSRDALIQAMGMLFLGSTIALGLSLQSHQLLTFELVTLSVIALPPALIGLVIGQLIRKRLSEQLFRRVFFISLELLGVYIVFTAFVG